MANGSSDYKLGKLTGGYHALNERFDEMCVRLDSLERKVDGLNIWRFKVIGAVSVIAILANFGINLMLKHI